MRATERNVKYFDCKVGATVRGYKDTSSNVPPVKLGTILRELKGVLDAGTSIQIFNSGETQRWQLVDIEITNDFGILLITRSDKDAADQAIVGLSRKDFKVAAKTRDEGNAYSAHVALRLKPSSDGSFLVLIEESLGINSLLVSRLMVRGIRAASAMGSTAFLYDHPSGALDKHGNLKKLRGRYKVELIGHPSDAFLYELDQGKLLGIEVVDSTATKKFWDAYNATEYVSRTVKLKPLPNPTTPHAKIVASVCENAKLEKMAEVRVRFEDTSQFSHTVVFNAFDGKLVNEDKFVKKASLRNFPGRLDTAFQAIHAEIRDKMFFLLR